MDITLQPTKLRGTAAAPPSKSIAHRMLICAAFADKPTTLLCAETNQDIEATADCLRALGATIQRTEAGYAILPITRIPESADLYCHESGSTLRFLLPIVGALGVTATFHMEGRLPQRPLSPLWEEMERMGCNLSRSSENTIRCTGKLKYGTYYMDGSVSSQFLSGLEFAFWIMGGHGLCVHITGVIQSRPYYEMTRKIIARFSNEKRRLSSEIVVEGDWSNGAFWLTAAFLGSELTVLNLDECTTQGDLAIIDILPQIKSGTPTISAADIPDLVPILSVAAAANRGAIFTDIARLRLKESDRVASTIAMIESLGGKAEATEDTFTVYGTGLTGGIVDSCNDHRIAMSAAIAATVCTKPVTILGAECVRKSYPKFWEDYAHLGGIYEKYLR